MFKINVRFKRSLLLATYVIILSYLLLNLKNVGAFISEAFNILTPFTLGIAIAFILNIPMKLFEKHVFSFLDRSKNRGFKKLKRPLSITAAFLCVLGFIIGLILFVIPQLVDSVSSLKNTIPYYLNSLDKFITDFISTSDLLATVNTEIFAAWQDFLKLGGQLLTGSLSGILSMTLGFTTGVTNLILAIVLAIYMLASKEMLLRQMKQFVAAFFSATMAKRIYYVCHITNLAFYRFIVGQFTEALIIGILCFIGMSIFSMPYALLISVMVGVTALIPIFGAFIGTVPAAFIILLIDPIQALLFIVFIVILQQLEGNIIYPKVVGNSIGLSAIWIMFAMLVGGSTFGILGMLLGIPLFSVFYQLLSLAMHKRLKPSEKFISSNDK